MKTLSVSILFVSTVALSCGQSGDTVENLRGVTVQEPQIYFEGKVVSFQIKLHDIEGRCVVSYLKNPSTAIEAPKGLEVGMTTPCNFVRASWRDFEPLSYVYKKGKRNEVRVLIITGGPPDAEVKDEFQPKGCGTQIRKILVYADRIDWEEDKLHTPGPSVCPGGGLDEVWFAA